MSSKRKNGLQQDPTSYNKRRVANVQKKWGGVSATAALDRNAKWRAAVNTPNTYATATGRLLDLGLVEAGTRNRYGGARIAHDVESNKTTVSGQTRLGGVNIGGKYIPQENAATLNAQKRFGRTGVEAAYDSRGSGVNLSARQPIAYEDATGHVYGKVNTSNIRDLTVGFVLNIPSRK